ncbi:phage antirepressor [Campylobacter coli]|uniref:Antirepressor, BRO family protein n=2 Tax=Campylobacter TaxID=194 RepID=A0A5T1QSF0_CAMJU|nr:phage antirepressor KilAC domain-containing protein [Campylobacter coli]EAL4027688.1 antirepressor, BRO family protein [Campylobacter jejuni]EAH6872897.1 antirepressor, BRO family protein [Campylobacter coli]EAH9406232.1 antirepressor, BRO family protein [Campylobacter coli]EAI3770363.1 antirepressor, BRO family protein [Campylobacter coli]EAI4819459.1 antirepressor, BRO family protein [Campylobacter coli]
MNLEIFKKDNLAVRVIKDENNEPLFCLSDVCKALELTNPSMVKDAILKEFELSKLNLGSFDTGFGVKEFIMIDEAQLYYVMNNSRSKNAKPFRMWVNKEVLPSIRKNGNYGFKPLTHKEALLLGLELLEKNEKLELENKSLKEKELENAPLIHFANRIKDTNDAILIRDFAKILYEKNKIEIGEKRLFAFLRDNGFLMSDNKPYQKCIEQGLFKVSETTISTINGDRLVSTTKITGKGQIKIANLLLEGINHAV